MESRPAVAPNTNWLKTIAFPLHTTLDIVAVHGMNLENNDDHADNTWTEKTSGKNWLRDFLPSKIPYARILAYQYNANVVFGTSSAGVGEQAMNLLNLLQSERESHGARPIIFIAHSLGGILVKEALAIASTGDGTHAMIPIVTYGIAFFGVPHRGSAGAAWGITAAKIIGLVAGRFNMSFLNSVESGSAYNEILNRRFKPLLERYKIMTICEMLPETLKGKRIIIVDKTSAVLGLPENQESTRFFNRTHSTVCKFADEFEPEWIEVSHWLCQAAESAVGSLNYSPIVFKRKEKLDDIPRYHPGLADQTFSVEKVVQQAQEVLKDIEIASKENVELHEVQQEVDSLTTNILEIVGWFVAILFPILVAVNILIPLSFMINVLPSKAIIMREANKVQKPQQEIVQLERLTLERLDDQRSRGVQAIKLLQAASLTAPLHEEHNTGVPDLENIPQLYQELNGQTERIVREMRSHQVIYDREEGRLREVEEGLKVAEGMEKKDLYIWIPAKAREDRAKYEENLKAQEKEGRWCPWWFR